MFLSCESNKFSECLKSLIVEEYLRFLLADSDDTAGDDDLFLDFDGDDDLFDGAFVPVISSTCLIVSLYFLLFL